MLQISFRYGLYAGFIMLVLFVLSWTIFQNMSFGVMEIYGYIAMFVSLSVVYFGVKKIRDNITGGIISFKDALLYGCVISVIAAIMIGLFDTIYAFYVNPEYMQDYYTYMMEQVKNSDRSAEEIKRTLELYQSQIDNYTPFFNFMVMFGTVIIIGIIVSLFTALRLKRVEKVS